MEKKDIGILGTLSAPLLPRAIASFLRHGLEDICVILDMKDQSAKDRAIWQERTEGRLDNPSLNVYSFGDQGIPFYLVSSHNDNCCEELIKNLSIKTLVNSGTPRKLSSEIISAPTTGVINVHPGVLPKYRGATCVEWSIFNDDPVGNTAHFMEEGYDSGPIIEVETYKYPKGSTYVDIRVDLYLKAVDLMARSTKRALTEGLFPSRLPAQEDGVLHKPIDDSSMKKALERLRTATYSGLY